MKNPFLFIFFVSNLLLGGVSPAFAIGNKAKNEAAERPEVESILNQKIMETAQLLEPSNKGCVKAIRPAEDLLSQMIVKNYNSEAISRVALAAVICAFSYDDFEATIRITENSIPYSNGEIKDYMLIGSILSSYYDEKNEKIFSFIDEIDPNNTLIMKLINADVFFGIMQSAAHTKKPDENRYKVLKLVQEMDYSGFSAGDKMDFANLYIYNTALLESKNPDVEDLIFEINNPDLYLNILVDNRFDFIKKYKKYDEFANIKAQVSRMENYVNSLVIDNPKELTLVNSLAKIKRYLGKNDEALLLLNKAISKAESDPDYFTDSDSQLNWTIEGKANSLFGQGKIKDGLAVFEKSKKIKESGYENVSQSINYAAAYLDFGYYDQAIKTVSNVPKERSKFADVLVATIDGCARYKRNDKKFDLAKIEKELSSIEENDFGMSMVNFYACMGDVDKVSKTIVKLLDNPEYRAETLVLISATLSPGEYLSKQKNDLGIIITQAIKSETVMKAINKYGYIINIPLDKNLMAF